MAHRKPWFITVIPLIVVLAAAVATIVLLRGCDDQTTGTFTTQLGGQWFTLETAIDKETQRVGLANRESIANDGGMIFIFDEDIERNFWMLDCTCDMDIIYVDRAGHVVSSFTMKQLPPQQPDESRPIYEERVRRDGSYPSGGKARYVIELRAGKVRELGLRRGDTLDLDLKRLKTLATQTDEQ